MEKKGHRNADLESSKFESLRKPYYEGLQVIKSLGYSPEDYIQHFPCFAGHLTISRFLTMYELYKRSLGIAGHIADVGVYKGASLLMFAKLVLLHEANALTQVHGFDWFRGCEPGVMDKHLVKGGDRESYERVARLIEAQQLDHIAKVHVVDLRKDLDEFFVKYPHLKFRLVFLDAGTYENIAACLPHFWPRIVSGGLLVLDQYNHELAPGEVAALDEYLPNAKVRTIQNSWMPNGYIVKE